MTAWYVDHGLQVLINQVKALKPGCTIGTIGDASHTAEGTGSDHNPKRDGAVCAADFMIAGPINYGFDNDLVAQLVAHRDHRIKYIIWQRHIISSTVDAWVWRPYSGSDPHTNHVHVSVNESDNKEAWNITAKAVIVPGTPSNGSKIQLAPWPKGPNDAFHPYLKGVPPVYVTIGHIEEALKQAGLYKGAIDGQYGAQLYAAIMTFQHQHQLTVDGLIGPKTYNAIRALY